MTPPEPLTPEYAQAVRDGVELPCPVDGCRNSRPISHAMCRRCWPLVPKDVQSRVYRAWGARCRFRDARTTAAHEAAIEDAVSLASKHRREREAARTRQQSLDL